MKNDLPSVTFYGLYAFATHCSFPTAKTSCNCNAMSQRWYKHQKRCVVSLVVYLFEATPIRPLVLWKTSYYVMTIQGSHEYQKS